MKKTRQECRCWEDKSSHLLDKEHKKEQGKPRHFRGFQGWDDKDWMREMYSDVYNQDRRNADLENDELAAWEAAFMEGYDIAA